MNVLQGHFYSTAFCVADKAAFDADPVIASMRQLFEFYRGVENDVELVCITSKGDPPGTRLRVMQPAIIGLLRDAPAGCPPLEDDCGWIDALQRHLDPAYGIVIAHQLDGKPDYFTYIAADCAGWTRGDYCDS
ncbi:MAG: hypothetical protein KIS63_00260 [Caldilineales bacterium]|nr:hypothetical protein [Planctomycetales bacterium]MCW5856689.1 hypothetical protein [Caldilineales bacterium]